MTRTHALLLQALSCALHALTRQSAENACVGHSDASWSTLVSTAYFWVSTAYFWVSALRAS